MSILSDTDPNPEPIVISDSDPDPVYEWRIKDLNLLKLDLDVLTDGMELTDNLINATLVLLDAQFWIPKYHSGPSLGLQTRFRFQTSNTAHRYCQQIHKCKLPCLLYLQSDSHRAFISQIILICTISYFAGNRHWVCTSRALSGAMQIMDSLSLFMKMNVGTPPNLQDLSPNSVLQLHKLSVH